MPGDTVTVRPDPRSAFGAISAWIAYKQPPSAVRAYVYTGEIFDTLTPPIPFNSHSVLATRKGEKFFWAHVPGANYSRAGSVNHLVTWVRTAKDGPWTYAGDVVFAGVSAGGIVCGSPMHIPVFGGPIGSGMGVGSRMDVGSGIARPCRPCKRDLSRDVARRDKRSDRRVCGPQQRLYSQDRPCFSELGQSRRRQNALPRVHELLWPARLVDSDGFLERHQPDRRGFGAIAIRASSLPGPRRSGGSGCFPYLGDSGGT